MLDNFRPGVVLVMFVALAGFALTVVPLLRRRTRAEPEPEPEPVLESH
jgi:hypothetical protein